MSNILEDLDITQAELNSMTTEDAITWLNNISNKYVHGGDEAFDRRRNVALAKAIKALQKNT